MLRCRRLPPGFLALLVTAFLTHCVTSAVVALLAVFVADVEGEGSAISLSGLAVAGSYLVSALMASRAESRLAFAAGIATCGVGCWLVGADQRVVGIGLLALGIGLFRPSVLARMEAQRGWITSEHAAAYFTVTLNLGYVGGPLLADWLRHRHSWSVAFLALTAIATIAFASAVWMFSGAAQAERLPDQAAPKADHPPALLAVVCVAVAAFYFIQQQSVSSLALIAEGESSPVTVGRHSLLLSPGQFAALHGLMAAIAAMVIARLRIAIGAFGVAVGLVGFATIFLLLSKLAFPVSQSWIGLAFVLFSAAESTVGSGLLAVGAGFRRNRRVLFWGSAVVGIGIGAVGGLVWEVWSHTAYFAVIALLTLTVAALVLWRSLDKGWR